MSQGQGGGRPIEWPPEAQIKAVDEICNRLASEISVRAICEDEHLPPKSLFYQWISQNEKFMDKYARAKAGQVEFLLDDIPDIADDRENDYITIHNKDGTEYEKVNNENIQRSRLRVDARIKLAEKLAPKKYSIARTELTGANGGPIVHNISEQIREVHGE